MLFKKGAQPAEPAMLDDKAAEHQTAAAGQTDDLTPTRTTATEDIVYPTGLKLALLLLSVFISMFLVALVCVLRSS